ncbi:hypothetical protein [Aquabacterium sp.]|uniref:hypothetical protein n=1 Tax=Aquabacterium sp. TaxID=1872578 RepID=UPI0037852846
MNQQYLDINLIVGGLREDLQRLKLGGGLVSTYAQEGQEGVKGIFRVTRADGTEVQLTPALEAELMGAIRRNPEARASVYGIPPFEESTVQRVAGSQSIDVSKVDHPQYRNDRPKRSDFASEPDHVRAVVAWEKARGFTPGGL